MVASLAQCSFSFFRGEHPHFLRRTTSPTSGHVIWEKLAPYPHPSGGHIIQAGRRALVLCYGDWVGDWQGSQPKPVRLRPTTCWNHWARDSPLVLGCGEEWWWGPEWHTVTIHGGHRPTLPVCSAFCKVFCKLSPEPPFPPDCTSESPVASRGPTQKGAPGAAGSYLANTEPKDSLKNV